MVWYRGWVNARLAGGVGRARGKGRGEEVGYWLLVISFLVLWFSSFEFYDFEIWFLRFGF